MTDEQGRPLEYWGGLKKEPNNNKNNTMVTFYIVEDKEKRELIFQILEFSGLCDKVSLKGGEFSVECNSVENYYKVGGLIQKIKDFKYGFDLIHLHSEMAKDFHKKK